MCGNPVVALTVHRNGSVSYTFCTSAWPRARARNAKRRAAHKGTSCTASTTNIVQQQPLCHLSGLSEEEPCTLHTYVTYSVPVTCARGLDLSGISCPLS